MHFLLFFRSGSERRGKKMKFLNLIEFLISNELHKDQRRKSCRESPFASIKVDAL